MARHEIIEIIDDLDESVGAKTVKFALDGKHYEIDLSDANKSALQATLAPYMKAGRRQRGGRATVKA
jgi:hypothetical protein